MEANFQAKEILFSPSKLLSKMDEIDSESLQGIHDSTTGLGPVPIYVNDSILERNSGNLCKIDEGHNILHDIWEYSFSDADQG